MTHQDLIAELKDKEKGCGKEITYEYHLENEFSKTRIGSLGKCGDKCGFMNKKTLLCDDCKKAVKK
jgi:hypothetical protein